MNARSPSESKGASLRTRLREQTAAAILDAAEEVFAERGIGAAHMNDIAARAGVAVGTLYNHFADRDALLDALLQERRHGLLAVMDEFLDQPGSGDFAGDLKALVQRMGGYFEAHRRFHQILHQCDTDQSLAAYPRTAASAPEMRRQLHLRLEKLIKRGLKHKALRPELAPFYPAILLGIIRAIKMQQRERGSQERLPIDEVVRLFMEGARA